ncbi:hypothetical protein [Ferruginibacter sp.]|nr:hypothetical protein [Ferruginibacter sp.]
MLLRTLFITFITVSQLLHYAKAQTDSLNEFEGIFFYYETESSIPQEVFLLPCKVACKGSFADFADSTIKNYKGKLVEIYFQAMRWTMPSFLQEVERMNYIACKRLSSTGGSFNMPMRISAGKIFANAPDFLKLHEYAENNTDFVLEYNTVKYNFISYDFDVEKKGLPVSFEPLYVK